MILRRGVLIIGMIALGLLLTVPVFAECDGAGVLICAGRDLSGVVLSDGNDNLTIQKEARIKNSIGNGVDAGYGDDYILNEGSISSKVRGLFGDTGNDTLINHGSITDGDSGIYGGVGSDTIENTGLITARLGGIEAADVERTADFDVVTNSGTINVTNGSGIMTFGKVTNSGRISARGDGIVGVDITNSGRVIAYGGVGLMGDELTNDLIVNAVGGYVQGVDGIQGWSGDDVISNYGEVVGGIQGWYGNDVITLYGGVVQGEINCGADVDTLIFALTLPTSQLNDLTAQLLEADPALGSVTVGRTTYSWRNCEVILNQAMVKQ